MPELEVNGRDPNSPEHLTNKSRREFISVLVVAALATLLHQTQFPTIEQVKDVYLDLLRKNAESEEGFVEPIPILNPGDWRLTQRRESIYEENINRPRPEGTFPGFRSEIRSTLDKPIIMGDYTFHTQDGNRKFFLHLGVHDNFEANSITIDSSKEVGITSMDSVHSVSSYIDFEPDFNEENRIAVPVENIDPELIETIEKYELQGFLDQWIANFGDEGLVLATDLPIPSSVSLEITLRFAGGYTSLRELDKHIFGLKEATVLFALTAGSANGLEMIRKLFVGKTSRREFLKLPFTLLGTAAKITALMNLMGYIPNILQSNQQIMRNQAAALESEMVDKRVRNRTQEEYLGRVEAIIAESSEAITLTELFMTLRDLVSTYKEVATADSNNYLSDKKPTLVSVWGALHDTKIGLLALSQEALLDLIRRFYERHKDRINIFFIHNPNSPFRERKIEKSLLWTASIYNTELADNTRKIKSIEILRFPELFDIFNH